MAARSRQVQVDIDPNLLYAKHFGDGCLERDQPAEPDPAGRHARIGDREFIVKLNSSPHVVSALNDLPVRAANGAVVCIKDVAQVRMGYAAQTNIVRQDGKRAALLTVLKNGKTSTLDIVAGVKADAPAGQGRPAAGPEDHAAVRPVDLRRDRSTRSCARRRSPPLLTG